MSKEYINAKRIIIETEDERIIYDLEHFDSVFKITPDSRGRVHLGTTNKVVVIKLKSGMTK